MDLHDKDAVVEAHGMSTCRGCCSTDVRKVGSDNQGEHSRSPLLLEGAGFRGWRWKNPLSPKI